MTGSASLPTVPPLPRRILIAVLAALQLVMVATGIAYIPIGPLRLTFLTLPVAVGGALLGPAAGAVLGAVFGISSFLTCLGVFSMDPLGAVLLGIQPVLLFLVCVVPRILCGWLPALACRALSRSRLGQKDKSGLLPIGTACLLTPLLNTLFFLSGLWLCFADSFLHSSAVTDLLGGTVSSVTALFAAFAGVNALLEAAVGLVAGTAVCKALSLLLRRMH